jgi:hypothetical protein
MRIIGSPIENNQLMKSYIEEKVVLSRNEIQIDDSYFDSLVVNHMDVLDIGNSLRNNAQRVTSLARSYKTLDINVFESYPDIQMDLCEDLRLPGDLKFDVIFSFSILEHCYNPFIASRNLFGMLKPNSMIIGSVPFLFPHHYPEDLSYQDYFRFTVHSFASLFPDATRIMIYPHRGRVGAGLNVISQRYKDVLERYASSLTARINSIDRFRRPNQTSGFHFEIFN